MPDKSPTPPLKLSRTEIGARALVSPAIDRGDRCTSLDRSRDWRMFDSAGSLKRESTSSSLARVPNSLPEAQGCDGLFDLWWAHEDQLATRTTRT